MAAKGGPAALEANRLEVVRMTIGQTRTTTKKEQSVERFLNSGGKIKEFETQRSEFRPTWEAYANSAFEDRGHEA